MIGLYFAASPPPPPPAFSRSASPAAALLRRASPAIILLPRTLARSRPWNRVRCRSSSGGGAAPGPGSSENESKAVLDAFFLGKAFAEALNERIESTVGELFSVVGQWQAEQQKQVQDFQLTNSGRSNRKGQKSQGESCTGGRGRKWCHLEVVKRLFRECYKYCFTPVF